VEERIFFLGVIELAKHKFKTNEKQNKMVILFRPFDLLAPKDLNYVALQSLDFERT
jgi:hypothetical protein